jgi:membrane-associated protein
MLGAIVKTVVNWFGPAFSSQLGYLLVGGVVFLDRGAFIGIVVPGDLFLALGGIYAGRGELSITSVILVGALAGLLGETLSYWLGRLYGVRVIRHLPFTKRLEGNLERARDYFHRHGGRTVFIGRYVSVAGTFVPFVAGMSDMPFPRFLAFDVAAIGLWASGVSLLGYFLNSEIHLVDSILSKFGWGLLILAVAYVGGRFGWKRRDRIRKWLKSQRKRSERTRT